MILIGSRALAIRAPKLLFRQPKDFDFISTREEAEKWLSDNSSAIGETERYEEGGGKKLIVKGKSILEFELISPETSSAMLRDIVEQDPESLETKFGLVPTLDMLFTIKSSHRYKKDDFHMWKTFCDYHAMKNAGCKVRPEYLEFFSKREKETYTNKTPRLMGQTKESFFVGDGVQYTYIHDDIHEAVKHLDKPAYQYYMKDGAEVQSDKNKFFACPHEIRLYGVIEEAATLAVERSLVPHSGVLTPKQAWMLALSKVMTSITSGFFRSWAYDNGVEVIKNYPEGYWEKFNEAVKLGKVRRMPEVA